MICNGTTNEAMDTAYDKQNKLHHSHSLVSIKPTKQPDHTQELGDGVTAKFVSFNLDDHDNDDDTRNESKSPGGTMRRPSENDLRNAPKVDWGIQYIPVNQKELFHFVKRQVSKVASSGVVNGDDLSEMGSYRKAYVNVNSSTMEEDFAAICYSDSDYSSSFKNREQQYHTNLWDPQIPITGVSTQQLPFAR